MTYYRLKNQVSTVNYKFILNMYSLRRRQVKRNGGSIFLGKLPFKKNMNVYPPEIPK
jgi:hypothetical protein